MASTAHFFVCRQQKTPHFMGITLQMVDCGCARLCIHTKFCKNRLLAYICLYKLGLNYMGAILAAKFEKEILP